MSQPTGRTRLNNLWVVGALISASWGSTFWEAAAKAQHESSQQESARQESAQVVRVGLYENHPKLFTDDSGDPSGFYIDIFRYIAERENWTIEYVPCVWQQCLARIEKGDLDLMPDVVQSEERDRRFDFNQKPFFVSWSVVYTHTGITVDSIVDLDQRRVAVLEESIQYDALAQQAREFGIEPQFVEVDDFGTMFQLLADGNVDAGVFNRFFGSQAESDYPSVGATPILVHPSQLYAIASDGNDDLLAAVDRTLIAMKADRTSPYYEAFERWLEPTDKTTQTDIRYLVLGMVASAVVVGVVSILVWNRKLAKQVEERKQAEEKLRKSEQRFRRAIAHAPFPIIIYADDGEVLQLSSTWTELTGYAPDDIPTIQAWAEKAYGDRASEILREKIIPNYDSVSRRDEGDFTITTQTNQQRIWQFSSSPLGTLSDGRRVTISMAVDVTEHRKISHDLQESEAQSRAILAGIPDLIFRVSADGIYRGFSMSHQARSVVPLDINAQGRLMGEILPAEMAERQSHYLKRALETGHIQIYEQQVQVGDRLQDEEVRVVKIGDDEVLFIVRDITERKQTEQALRSSEAKSQAILDVIPDLIMRVGADGRYRDFPCPHREFNLIPEGIDILGRHLTEVLPLEMATQHLRCVDQVIQTGDMQVYEQQVQVGDRLQDEEVRVVKSGADEALFIIRDISEQKRAEAERLQTAKLRAELTLIESLFETVFAGYWDWDVPSQVEYYSPGFKRMFGYEDHELANVPETWQALIFPEDLSITLESYHRHVKSRGTIPYCNEVRYRHKDGSTVWVMSSGQVIEWDDQGKPLRMIGCHLDISARKHAEQALAASETRLKTLIDALPFGVWVRDANDTLILQNSIDIAQYGNQLGARLEDLDLLPEHIARYRAHKANSKIGEPYALETTERVNGEERSFLRIETLWNEAGKGMGMLGVAIDITELKQTKKALRVSEERLKTLIDTLPLGVWVRDSKGVLVLQNSVDIRRYGEILGTKPEKISIHPSYVADYLKAKQSIQPGEIISRETRELIADKEHYFLRLETPLPDEDGEMGMLGVAIDVTELKRTKEALQISEERLRTLIDALPMGVWVRDARGRLVLQNSEDIARFGEIIGTDLESDSIPSEWALIHDDIKQRCLIEGPIQYERQEVIHGEPRTFLQIDATLPDLDGGVGLFGVSIDITERKRSEEQIHDYAQQLEAINKELEMFTYSVSHDLRAPLRHIGGFINALKQQLGETNALQDAKVAHYIEVIQSSSKKMAALIEGLLTLSRVGRREMARRSVDLQRIVQMIVRNMHAVPLGDALPETGDGPSPAMPQTPEFIVHELPTVEGDETLLYQAFYNVIDNAVKFSCDRHPPRIEIGVLEPLPDEHQCTIFVRDNGVGFDMAYADQLFGVFQRLHSAREFAGTGIGLSIVQRIIHRHGGEIWAESRPNNGSCFYLKLTPFA